MSRTYVTTFFFCDRASGLTRNRAQQRKVIAIRPHDYRMKNNGKPTFFHCALSSSKSTSELYKMIMTLKLNVIPPQHSSKTSPRNNNTRTGTKKYQWKPCTPTISYVNLLLHVLFFCKLVVMVSRRWHECCYARRRNHGAAIAFDVLRESLVPFTQVD